MTETTTELRPIEGWPFPQEYEVTIGEDGEPVAELSLRQQQRNVIAAGMMQRLAQMPFRGMPPLPPAGASSEAFARDVKIRIEIDRRMRWASPEPDLPQHLRAIAPQLPHLYADAVRRDREERAAVQARAGEAEEAAKAELAKLLSK